MTWTLRHLVITVIAVIAADLPYAGKWKVNWRRAISAKHRHFSKPARGRMANHCVRSYLQVQDGWQEYPDHMGGTAAWKAVAADTWELVAKANGKVTETDTFELGTGGKALTDTVKQMKADGGSIESTTVYQRVSRAARRSLGNGRPKRSLARPGWWK